MRNFLQAFLAFLVLASVAQFFFLEKEKVTKNDSDAQSIVKRTKLPNIKKDSIRKKIQNPEFNIELTLLKFKDKFVTSSKNNKVLFPKQFHYFKDSIFTFLNNNQQKEIVITAHYLENEIVENNSNLGVQRASYLKNKLIKYGVNPAKIITKNELAKYKYDFNGFYANGITIQHQNIHPKKLKVIQQEIKNKAVPVYFANKTFKPNRSLYTYVLEVKNHLAKNGTAKINITSYTDNIGHKQTNHSVAIQRAKNVSDYFIKQGISKDKIITLYKEKTKPIDRNTSKKGRVNNKIEIIIN